MRALLDVNVLIALLDQAHPHQDTALAWLKANIQHGWASCPITQNGCIRIMSQASYPGARPVAKITERLRDALNHSAHKFWPDDVSIVDTAIVDGTRVHGARQITDTYLLALALKNGGRLVTFDSGIALAAVKGATARQLVTLV
ncbi:MAG: PIN domain-containing protein [Betaproteobacteria bacterium]|nr:PIN domain-containing protein [Betaproteobacteria bacterium]MBK9607134.1 PIN domain-containing protein [Betaproteobacteria bacterium]